jgi:hypothetical protein
MCVFNDAQFCNTLVEARHIDVLFKSAQTRWLIGACYKNGVSLDGLTLLTALLTAECTATQCHPAG